MTVGPWKPITLEAYTTRIAEVDVRADVSGNLDAKLSAAITLTSSFTGVIDVQVKSPAGDVVVSERLNVNDSKGANFEKSFAGGEVELWYPVGYGKQPLYSLNLSLLDQVSQPMTLPVLFHTHPKPGK